MTDPTTDNPRPPLWAPWRMTYLEGAARSPEPGCFFCEAVAHPEEDGLSFVVLRGEGAFVMLNRYPYSNGHLMVAPAAHQARLDDMGDAVLLELMRLTRDCQALLTETLRPDGFNVGINIGKAAGAGVPGHLHIHVVPRWNGDTNFMTTVGGLRVIPESLEATHAKLSAAAGKLGLPRRGGG